MQFLSGRLLREVGSAAWNMAFDEALLIRAAAAGRPVLRFYHWQSPALTVGRFQNVHGSLNLERCRQLGIPLIRRPTGGRAVYHDADLTYSLLLPENLAGASSIRESYANLSAAFLRAFADDPASAAVGGAKAPGRGSSGDCFATITAADLAADGRKIVGSAQVRRGGWILQQGSLRLWPMDIPTGLFSDDAPSLEIPVFAGSSEAVQSRLAAELGALLDLEWCGEDASAEEKNLADDLVKTTYGTGVWNLEGRMDGWVDGWVVG